MIRSALIATLIVVFVIFIFVLFTRYKKVKIINIPQSLILLIISAVLVELIVKGFFTPLWLYDMAKTPILVAMQIRAIKGGVMVFINSFVGYAVYETILKRLAK